LIPFSLSHALRRLPSFPTRRSSDLAIIVKNFRNKERRCLHLIWMPYPQNSNSPMLNCICIAVRFFWMAGILMLKNGYNFIMSALLVVEELDVLWHSIWHVPVYVILPL